MTHHYYTKLATAIAMGLSGSYASAAGFQLLEQNLSGLGSAYAGTAAVAENASTIFFNPAGMTQLKEREFSGGLAVIVPSFKFSDSGSSVGALAGAGNGGDAGDVAFVPNAYLSWPINKDLVIGAGFGAPFGLKTEYDKPWIGAAQAVSFGIETYNFNPSIAYRVNDAVSVGAGLNFQHIDAEYKRVAAVSNGVTAAANVTAKLAGDSWGWNVGGLFTLSPETKVGVSYRSAISYDTTGRIVTTGLGAGPDAALTSDAEASLKLPDMLILSGTHQLSDKWQLLGDLAWTGWSSIPKLDLVRASGVVAQTLDSDFKDAWRVSVGANYQYSQNMKLKFGLAFDQSPVKGEATRLVSLPDNDRTWLTTGAQWALDSGARIDLGLGYLMIADSTINNDQRVPVPAAASRGLVKGNYSGSVWILGLQYSMLF